MFYSFCKWLANMAAKIFFSVRYEGMENIPDGEGFILACNHQSYWDPVVIAWKIKAPLTFMAKSELFRNPIFGWIISHLGAFPIERGSGDGGAIDRAVGLMSQGKALVIFPEGTRSKNGKPGRARSGLAVVAAQTKANVLPCGVAFAGPLRFRQRITVRYGKLIPFQDLALENASPGEIKRASQMVMGKIIELVNIPS